MSTVECWMLLWAVCCFGGAWYISGAILKVFFAVCKKIYHSLG